MSLTLVKAKSETEEMGGKIRAAVIGLGRIGWWLEAYDVKREKPCTHVGAYIMHPDTELVGVCDIDRDRLSDFEDWYTWFMMGEEDELVVATDFKEMLKTAKPDLVSVATPTDTHYEIVKEIVESPYRPRAVFCEKPLTENWVEASHLISLCEDNGVILAVNQTRRWDKLYQRVKEIIDSGELGELRAFRGVYSGGRLRCGVHMTDLAAWYTEQYPEALIDIVHIKSVYLIFEVDIIGTEGRIEIKDNGYEVHYYLPIESERYDDIAELAEFSKYAELPTYSFSKAMLNAVGDLVKCIRKGGQPKCTGEDGLKALKLMEVVR